MNILNAFFLAAICLLTSLGITITGSMTVTESVMITGQASDTLKYDSQTGLVVDKNMALVVASCSACHSTELIRQNRFTRDGWIAKIRWMQREHNLWDLGESEKAILDYLEKYYSPSSMDARAQMRRAPLGDIEWYDY
ncbi:MAG TPA: hypothetical protein VIR29_13545 [Anseongella sp.]